MLKGRTKQKEKQAPFKSCASSRQIQYSGGFSSPVGRSPPMAPRARSWELNAQWKGDQQSTGERSDDL